MLVDDEQNILNALRRCLALIDATQIDGDALVVETFTSPEAALERGEERDFDLVMSDYRMPSMNGVEFLTRFMKLQPQVPRVIVSAFADRDAIIAAINETNLSRFIQKPWNDEELRATVTTILGGRGKTKTPDSQGDTQLRSLEQECPGITHVERGEDGGIVIDLDDDEEFFK
jgi:DNA-binding NtrC family response regulator